MPIYKYYTELHILYDTQDFIVKLLQNYRFYMIHKIL